MKKLVYLFAFSALLFYSCSPSVNSSPVIESDILVRRAVEYHASDESTITTNYTYDGKKIVGTTNSVGNHEDYIYTDDLITSIKLYDATNTLVKEQTFTYDAGNSLTTYLSNDYVTALGRKQVFVYNSNGTVSYTVYGGDNTAQSAVLATGTIVSSTINGEVTKIVTTVPLSSTRIYTYDKKNNPFKNVTGIDKLNFINEQASGIAHNILSDHYTDSASSDDLTNMTYTYNSLNFPKTAYEILGSDPASIITTEYTYNN